MNKKHKRDYIEVEQIEPTFLKGRACKHCSKPIPDQEHGIRKYCVKTKDVYGNSIDCKSDYYSEKEAPDKAIHIEIMSNHKSLARRINELLSKKSQIVTTQDLDAYDIDLQQSLEYFIKPNGVLTSVFLEHSIITNPHTKTHKIVTNDK
jgi:hypothetical protein